MGKHTVSTERAYHSSKEDIINLFRSNTLFRLTGANNIQTDFRTGGLFTLTFTGRGIISGKFVKISGNEIILEWDVEGFQRPPEVNTIVEFIVHEENENCILSIVHKNILYAESAEAKKNAWAEIVEDVETHLKKSGNLA